MGQLAPHDGKELELMLLERKELSLFFSDMVIPDKFFDYIEAGVFNIKRVILQEKTPYQIDLEAAIIFRPNHQSKADRLSEILKESRSKFEPQIEREIGKLLGYDEEDIEFYIEHIMNMNNINRTNEKF